MCWTSYEPTVCKHKHSKTLFPCCQGIGQTCLSYIWRERVDFSKLLQSLNFLFIEVKSFSIFFIAMQGWVGGNFHKTFFYFLCIFLHDNTLAFCLIELLAIMHIYVLYNLDILCTIIFCFARLCTLLRVSSIKWYPTTNVWVWLLHIFEF